MARWPLLLSAAVGALLLGAGSAQVTPPTIRVLNATLVIEPPYVVYEPTTRTFSGFCIELFEMVLKRLNDAALAAAATHNASVTLYVPRYRLVADGKYGSKVADGSWNGAIGELLRDEADIALGQITWSASRQTVVDFTGSWAPSPRGLLVRKTLEYDAWAFLRPFTGRMWACILLTTLVFGLLLTLVDRASPYGNRRLASTDEGKRSLNAAAAASTAFDSMLGKSPTAAYISTAWSTKLLIYSLSIFYLLVSECGTRRLDQRVPC
jgi:hypothetical protein